MSYYTGEAAPAPRHVARAMRVAGHGGVIQLGDTLYQVVPDGTGLGGFSLKKIGKAIGKAAKQTVKVVKKAAPIALALAPIPIVGGLVNKALAVQKSVKSLAPVKAVGTAQSNLAKLHAASQPPIPSAIPVSAVPIPQYSGPAPIVVGGTKTDPTYNGVPAAPDFMAILQQRDDAAAATRAANQATRAKARADAAAQKAVDDAAKKAARAKARADAAAAKAAQPDATPGDAAAAAAATVAANAAAMQAQAASSQAPAYSGGGGGGGGGGYAAEPAASTPDASAPTDNTDTPPTTPPMGGSSGMLIAAGIAALFLLGGKH